MNVVSEGAAPLTWYSQMPLHSFCILMTFSFAKEQNFLQDRAVHWITKGKLEAFESTKKFYLNVVKHIGQTAPFFQGRVFSSAHPVSWLSAIHSFQLPDKMSKRSSGRPSSSTPLSRRCPCVGGRSSCVCSRWLISSWSAWSWRPAWVWAPWRGSTRCCGCGASAPLRAWMMSSRPCITWIYPAVPSCCRKAWRSCGGGLNRSKVSQPAEITQTVISARQRRTPEAAPGGTRTMRDISASTLETSV